MRYAPRLYLGAARQRGWYVKDLTRSTPHVEVFVGGRHDTEDLAARAADRLQAADELEYS